MLHGAIAAALVVAVAAVAFASQPPAFGVAELSPIARQTAEAPPTTAGAAAGARGGRGSRATTTSTAPPASSGPVAGGQTATPTTKVSRSRPCVGNPPRQTDDPMSPPCLATIFEGDNGGATSAGVSGTEIRVAVPVVGLSTTGDRHWYAALDALFRHFNDRFELYGRRLVPVYVTGSGSTAVDARAYAADIVSKGVFAAVTGMYEKFQGHVALPTDLVHSQIVTVVRNATSWWTDRLLFDQYHPYAWSVYPSAEDVQANLGDFACTSLAGHPASHAPDAALRRSSERRLAVVSFGNQLVMPTAILRQALTECSDVEPLTIELTGSMPSTIQRTAIERLRDSGVTTVICVCEASRSRTAISTAEAAGFHPEWIVTPTALEDGQDERQFQDASAAGEWDKPIRLDAGPRLLPLQARPWFGVLQSQLDAIFAGTAYGDIRGVAMTADFVYTQLLVLASGVQGAGPRLTPDTFAQALMSMTFPNTGAGQPPYWQASAGFGPGDHSFYDDYDVAWWSDTAPALDAPMTRAVSGSWCYLHQAARFRPGTYPADADQLLFNPDVPCR